MWLFQLLLAWALLYIFFRWLLFGGKDKRSKTANDGSTGHSISDRTHYLSDVPDALRPDIEPDEFDPTDFM